MDWHLLEVFDETLRKRLFAVLLLGTVVVTVVMAQLNRALFTAAAPSAVLSFEFAGDTESASAIVDSWNEPARLRFAMHLGLDFLYLPLYSTTLALACLLARNGLFTRGWRGARRMGTVIAWLQWVAGALDGVENWALWQVISGPIVDPYPRLAAWCAGAKFALVLLGLIYSLFGLAVRATRPAVPEQVRG